MSAPGSTPFTAVADGTRVQVHAQPGAKRTEIMGLHGDAVKIRVQAPPLEGRANEELVRFLADLCGIPRARVELVKGSTSRAKSFIVHGLQPTDVRRSLGI